MQNSENSRPYPSDIKTLSFILIDRNKMKKRNNLRKILTALVITFGCLSFFSLIMCVGGGGVINDLYSALEEIEELEKKNLLDNPPETISSIAKREIKLVHNSQDLKKYIQESESSLLLYERSLIIFTVLFFVSLVARICVFIGSF